MDHRVSLKKSHKIFTNRSLDFGKVKLIGFDMDYTLVEYRREVFEELAFYETLRKFIEAGYPEELLQVKFKPDFFIRGLVVDCARGHILKVDAHKYVKDAYHGYTQLTKEDRHSLYNRQRFHPENFLSVDSFFALSEVQLFAEIVDYMAKHPSLVQKSFREVYDDLRKFIDLSHQDGSIKAEVLAHPEKYIAKDKNLATTLVRLKDAGKFLFLLTNSDYSYTHSVMSYILDQEHEEFASWKDYWDVIIVSAGKPGFFVGSQSFFEIVQNTPYLQPTSKIFLPNKLYYGGNAKTFEESTGYTGDEILYIGDNLFGDIIRSKSTVNWRTMLIVDELSEQIDRLTENQHFIDEINQLLQIKEGIDEDMQRLRSKIAANKRHGFKAQESNQVRKADLLEGQIQKFEAQLNAKKEGLKQIEENIKRIIKEREKKLHPVWGGLMNVGLERSRFANQIRIHACLYSSKVSNLRFYSPYKKFISLYEKMPHME